MSPPPPSALQPVRVTLDCAAYDALLFDLDGVDLDGAALALLERARGFGLGLAVVSASRSCRAILEAAGSGRLFDVTVDGGQAAACGLAGKPAPDTFLEAARRLGAKPARAAVLAGAVAGVAAARAGDFARVVGVDRGGHAAALRDAGADVVIDDLAAVDLLAPPAPPSALDAFTDVESAFAGRRPALFLDYDGTLSAIVDHPQDAVLSEGMRAELAALAGCATVAIVSGRDLDDVCGMVGLPGLVYAGSHGFDIRGPGELRLQHPEGSRARGDLQRAADAIAARLAGIDGVLIERKAFAVTVHYRLVAPARVAEVAQAVAEVASALPALRRTGGKKIIELRPDVPWDKGRAVLWLLETLELDDDAHLPVYLGDDDTDEDAFRALRGRGLGILVAPRPQPTGARYRLASIDEVQEFLQRLRRLLGAQRGAHAGE